MTPWDDDHYPVAMGRLSAVVRAKAIEIANALLEEGMAIRVAIAKAKEWAERRGRL